MPLPNFQIYLRLMIGGAARKLSTNVAPIPPGGVAYDPTPTSTSRSCSTSEGRVRHEYGPGLEQVVDNQVGDFIFIEPGVPYEVRNLSDTDPVAAVVARSDASEWENIVTYDRGSRRAE